MQAQGEWVPWGVSPESNRLLEVAPVAGSWQSSARPRDAGSCPSAFGARNSLAGAGIPRGLPPADPCPPQLPRGGDGEEAGG